MNKRIYVATDGSAIGNPGPGGWAAVFACGREEWTISAASPWTTASEMELRAAVEALRSLDLNSQVELSSDSEYLIRGMRYLAARWCSQGWRNSRGLPLQHQALWQELLRLDRMYRVRWRWVRGHNGHPMQTRADAVAYSEAWHQRLEQRVAA